MKHIVFLVFSVIIVIITPTFANAQWVQTSLPNTLDVRAIVLSDTTLVAGTYNGSVYLSNDQGISWTPIDTGFVLPYHVLALAAGGARSPPGHRYPSPQCAKAKQHPGSSCRLRGS